MAFSKKPKNNDSRYVEEIEEVAGEVTLTDFRGRKKKYTTVASRLQQFWAEYPEYRIVTKIKERTNFVVVMRCKIYDNNDRLVATGHAEELYGSTEINETSALENAETSAIGRALATLGFGGESFASADEVSNAQKKGDELAEIRNIYLPQFEDAAGFGVKALEQEFSSPTAVEGYDHSPDMIRRAMMPEMPRLKRDAEKADDNANAVFGSEEEGDHGEN